MTDTLTQRDPWRVLRAVLETVPPDRTFSSSSWHEEADLAGLTGKQIVDAQGTAVDAGWLTPIGQWLDGQWSPNMVRAAHDDAKGRWVTAYRRTDVGQARDVISGQAELFQVPA